MVFSWFLGFLRVRLLKSLYKFASFSWINAPTEKILSLCIIFVLFSGGPKKDEELEGKIQRLVDMGVQSHRAVVALSTFDWNMEQATEQLFS